MLSGNARVLLGEIAACLQKLLESGENTTIDLLAMPLNATDLEWLRERLGNGEVRITLEADGEVHAARNQLPGCLVGATPQPGGRRDVGFY